MKLTANITPEYPEITVLKTVLSESAFEVTFNLNESIKNIISPSVVFVGLIVLTHPKEILSKKPKNNRKFITVDEKKSDHSFSLSDNLFSFKCPKNALKLINDYKKAVVYFAIVSKPENEGPVGFSANGVIAKGLDIYNQEIEETERINNKIKEKRQKNDDDDSEFTIRIR